MRLSDAILDSKIGALDRSLGFLFGAARGFLLAVVAFCDLQLAGGGEAAAAMGQDRQDAPGADSRPPTTIIAMLPEDAAATIEGWIKSKNAAAAPAEEPPDETVAPPVAVPAASPTPTPTPTLTPTPTSTPTPRATATPTASPSPNPSEKQKLNSLINKGVPVPAPAAPAVVPTPRKT